ncbi:MAG TPA: PAS domain-containing sensor histidine kinase, partial [Actinomycetota bacterium]|nr:PAS domain-containing sensor histidine kinase [Actinomycetota bacterium]
MSSRTESDRVHPPAGSMRSEAGSSDGHERDQSPGTPDASDPLYRLLAENSLDVISRHAPDGTVLYVSPACRHALGYEPDELIGRNGFDFVHPDDVGSLHGPKRAAGDPARFTYRFIRKDGTHVWMEAVVRATVDARSGELTEVIATARDITQRVKQEEALRHQTRLYEALLGAQSDLGEGFLIAEGDRIVYVNDAYVRMTGYTREELFELESLLVLVPEDERARMIERTSARARGEAVADHFETSLIRKDGARIEVEVAQKPINFSAASQSITIVRDVTERKRAEAATRESSERFAELYERERETAVRLRALDEMKNDFLSAVSHELRTPLTGILGFAQTLEANNDRLTDVQREDFVRRIVVNAQKLERLLSDLLDLDRAKRGILDAQRRSIDVASFVRQTAEEWMSSSDRLVTVDGSEATFAVDPAKVERIVENLLANAAKHTPPQSPIWVAVEPDADGVLIRVDDAGNGVPDDMKARIFEPFIRGAESPKHAPGTGIGLSLVRRFAEMHGGRAWVEDRH